MSVIYHKIWRDVWYHKNRTIQVVLIIAVGTWAVGMTLGGMVLMNQNFTRLWQGSRPAMITLAVDPPISQAMLDSVKGIAGVAEVDGERRDANIQWRLNSAAPWSRGILIARDDYEDQRLSRLALRSGTWPHRRQMAIEAGHNFQSGMSIELEIADKDRQVEVSGVVFNPTALPPAFAGQPIFYTTRDHFIALTGQSGFNLIRMRADEYSEPAVTALADRIERHLEKQGIETRGAGDFWGNRVTDPTRHPFQDMLNGFSLILVVIAVLSMFLGLFLVFNTMMAIVSQQTNQIGLMKALGASILRIVFIYLSNVLIYSSVALLVALPLSVIAARKLCLFSLSIFNIESDVYQLAPEALLVQVILALLAPMSAAMWPILAGVRITVREATSTYGIAATGGVLERLLVKFQFVPRLLALTISNTFRNKGRVILTLTALTGSGITFMMVMTTRESTAFTFDQHLLQTFNFNVSLIFEDDERIGRIESFALAQPDITGVEAWQVEDTTTQPASQPQSRLDFEQQTSHAGPEKKALLIGLPVPTTIYRPQIVTGRWLQPGDKFVVVLDRRLAAELGVGVGDWVSFDHGPKGESVWQIVGLQSSAGAVGLAQSVMMPRETLAQERHCVGKANTVWVQAVNLNRDSEINLARTLTDHYEANNIQVSLRTLFDANTARQTAESNLEQLGLIISLLGAMALVTAIVGGVALSGVLSINVMERRREIGVMRAIGATSSKIAALFVGEGLILALLSWLIALPVSVPASQLMTQTLAEVINYDVIYVYSEAGAWYWLAIVLALSILASWLPARNATRISVRESLSYN